MAALPEYRERDWMPNSEYPFYLINWKEASHTHSRTQNNSWLLELKATNPMMMNPKTAEKLQLKTGDKVWVKSPYGKVKATVQVTKRIHPEVVGIQHGFGHTALGKRAAGVGTADALLRPLKGDALSGQALHKETCVSIIKA